MSDEAIAGEQAGIRLGHRVTIKTAKGHPRYKWRATYIEGGKRRQKYFRRKIDAEAWAEKREEEALQHWVAATITEAERSAVIETRARLAELRVILRDAVNHAAAYFEEARRSCSVKKLVDEAVASREQAGRSKRYVDDLRSKLGRFSKAFGRRSFATITPVEIADWLHGLKLNPRSFNASRTALSIPFNDAQESGYLAANPVAKVKVASVKESKYSALGVERAASLLEGAEEAILPAIALGLFTGARDAELRKKNFPLIFLPRPQNQWVTVG